MAVILKTASRKAMTRFVLDREVKQSLDIDMADELRQLLATIKAKNNERAAS